tara:strand:+ start:548 stop:1579 length:1032 start_codon:yes stop_codon:yes gene_type:complete
MYKLVIRPLLFLFPPEFIHNLSFIMIKIICKIPFMTSIIKIYFSQNNKVLNKKFFNLNFKNSIGLAAGFDKNALLIKELSLFGFGHIEIGTITPKPQNGNKKPRLFRLNSEKSLINRMGFNNDGVEIISKRLENLNVDCIIGANIGKNKDTLNQDAWKDYLFCFKKLFHLVDYFVVNVSSPNTPGLRKLQNKNLLSDLLNNLQKENKKHKFKKPILLKISPDSSLNEIDDIITVVEKSKINGIVATNTSIDKSILSNSKTFEEGGISGKGIHKKSTEIIKYISKKTNHRLPIIGVGGISDHKTMIEKFNAGASLVQIYTGWIYEGPSLVKRMNKIMVNELSKN